MSRFTPLIAGVVLLAAGPVAAGPAQAAVTDLFACREIVTGTDSRSRPEGLERCVRDVVVKLTGQPALADDPRTAAIASRASALVEDFAYVDRMSDVPHHDEQGTRDRPYDLIAHLDPQLVIHALSAAGLRPWLVRPALIVDVSVAMGGASFRLDADGDAGERQREAVLAAAERFGMRVVLPSAEQLATGRMPALRSGAAILEGKLVWSDADFGWNARWHLDVSSADESWEIRGVSFDEAFRSGVGGAAARLAVRSDR